MTSRSQFCITEPALSRPFQAGFRHVTILLLEEDDKSPQDLSKHSENVTSSILEENIAAISFTSGKIRISATETSWNGHRHQLPQQGSFVYQNFEYKRTVPKKLCHAKTACAFQLAAHHNSWLCKRFKLAGFVHLQLLERGSEVYEPDQILAVS